MKCCSQVHREQTVIPSIASIDSGTVNNSNSTNSTTVSRSSSHGPSGPNNPGNTVSSRVNSTGPQLRVDSMNSVASYSFFNNSRANSFNSVSSSRVSLPHTHTLSLVLTLSLSYVAQTKHKITCLYLT